MHKTDVIYQYQWMCTRKHWSLVIDYSYYSCYSIERFSMRSNAPEVKFARLYNLYKSATYLRDLLSPWIIAVLRTFASIIRISRIIFRISVFEIARMIIMITLPSWCLTSKLAIIAVTTVIAIFAWSVRRRLEAISRFCWSYAAVLELG